jgi:hypothetical protein
MSMAASTCVVCEKLFVQDRQSWQDYHSLKQSLKATQNDPK